VPGPVGIVASGISVALAVYGAVED